MIVCHCRVVSDREIVDAIRCGAADVCGVAATCGAGSRCGGCLPVVRQLLAAQGLPVDEHLAARDIRQLLAGRARFPQEASA